MSDMERVLMKMWAERDEERSRIMVRIADDDPIELFSFPRESSSVPKENDSK